MSESTHSPEAPRYSRDQVLTAFKPFVDQGFTHPHDLPLDNPKVMAANRILDAWSEQTERPARENPTPRAVLEFALNRTTVFVDAGFSDPSYLRQVTEDWLDQDLVQAQEEGLTDLAAKIQAKIDEIESKLEP